MGDEKLVDEFLSKTEEILENKLEGKIKSCKICFDYMHSEYRLSLCVYSFCRNCLEEMIKVAIEGGEFPVKCPNTDCKEKLIIRDIENVLGEKSLKKLVESSKRDENNTYIPCPTIDCDQVFVEDHESDYFFCSSCGNVFCRKCKKLYHEGLYCGQKESEAFLSDGNEKSWNKKIP